jgi:acyl carrier protein
MTRERVLEKVTGLLREILDDDSVVVGDATTAADVPGWDSFNNINLMIGLEKALGIRFRTHEIEGLRNVGELIDLVGQKLA